MNRSRSSALVLVLVLILSTTAPAAGLDAPPPEFRAGIGAVPAQTLLELFTDLTVTALSFGTIAPDTETKNATVFAEWTRPTGARTSLIVHANYARYEKSYKIEGSGSYAGDITDDFYTLMLGLKRHYVLTRGLAIYGDVMVGACLLRSSTDIDEVETQNKAMVAWQVTPLGLRFGEKIALDVAAGFGYKGLFTVGLDVAF